MSWSTHWRSSLCSMRWATIPTGPGKPPLLVSGQRCPLTALCPQYGQALPVPKAEPDPRQELHAPRSQRTSRRHWCPCGSTQWTTSSRWQRRLAQCTVGWTQPHGSPGPPHPESSLLSQACRLHAPRRPRELWAQGALGWGAWSQNAVLCPLGLWSPPVAQESAPGSGWAPFLMGMVPGRPVAAAEASRRAVQGLVGRDHHLLCSWLSRVRGRVG